MADIYEKGQLYQLPLNKLRPDPEQLRKFLFEKRDSVWREWHE